MKLPRELILKLISACDEVEAWLGLMESATKCSNAPASQASRELINSITDLVCDDDHGDEQFVADNTDWQCLEKLRVKR